MRPVLRVQKLRCDAERISRPLNAPFQDVAGTEFLVELADIDGLALVPEGRVPGDDEEILEPGERGDDVVREPVAEVLLVGVAAQVLEGQDGDDGACGQGEQGVFFRGDVTGGPTGWTGGSGPRPSRK
jgi:hypothetical protein